MEKQHNHKVKKEVEKIKEKIKAKKEEDPVNKLKNLLKKGEMMTELAVPTVQETHLATDGNKRLEGIAKKIQNMIEEGDQPAPQNLASAAPAAPQQDDIRSDILKALGDTAPVAKPKEVVPEPEAPKALE